MNRTILAEVADVARERDDIQRIRADGHACPCTEHHDPQGLSLQRAQAVAGELIAMGVAADMLETVGYGTTQTLNGHCGLRQRRRQKTSVRNNKRVEFSVALCRPPAEASEPSSRSATDTGQSSAP